MFVCCSLLLRTNDFFLLVGSHTTSQPNIHTNAMDREREREKGEQLFRRSFSVLCRAADSPLMENKTPSFFFFFFSVCASLRRRRRRLSYALLSILFSRFLFLVSIITLYTHTHTLLVDIIGFVRVAIVVGCIRIFYYDSYFRQRFCQVFQKRHITLSFIFEKSYVLNINFLSLSLFLFLSLSSSSSPLLLLLLQLLLFILFFFFFYYCCCYVVPSFFSSIM